MNLELSVDEAQEVLAWAVIAVAEAEKRKARATSRDAMSLIERRLFRVTTIRDRVAALLRESGI